MNNKHAVYLALGQLAENAGNFDTAKQYYVAALAIELTPEAAVHLAGLRLKDGAFSDARALLEDARRHRPSTETTIAILQTLAKVEMAQGRTSQSAIALRQALKIDEKVFGPSHASIAPLLGQYAVVLRKLGDEKEAGRLEARAKWIAERIPLRPGVSLSTLSEYRHP